jgi:hypothetical protein
MAEKMTDVDKIIRELEEADIDDDGVCVRYFPYKSDVLILVNALKMYRGFIAQKQNKMEVVAALFGKRLGEEFKIKRFRYSSDGNRLTFVNNARFSENGLEIYDTRFEQWRVFSEENREILTGEAVILDD